MPTPLTATESADLDTSRPGTPASSRFDDIYFSVEGGLAESQAVFLAGTDFPARYRHRPHTHLVETGFGTGLNVLAAWHAWADAPSRPHSGHLHISSIERYPLSRDQLADALAHFPELSDLTTRLLDIWPGRIPGQHRLELAPNFTLDLHHTDIADALGNLTHPVDIWWLDGFSPARNPDMWARPVLDRIGRLSAPGARLATFTVAGAVRRGLAEAGFTVARVPGFARKRQRLEAVFPGTPPKPSPSPSLAPGPIIIGAGIAGASVARALIRAGLTPTVIRSPHHADRAASANPAALVKPRLDKQDRPESRFFLSAWAFAKQLYDGTPGITHYSQTPARITRHHDLATQQALPPEDFHMQGDTAHFPTSPVIDPVQTCKSFLYGSRVLDADITSWTYDGKAWHVFSDEQLIASGPQLVLASGLHLKTALPDLDLRASRGQLSWCDTDLDHAVTYGGYAIPLQGRTLLGATHDRLDDTDLWRLSPHDDQRNGDQLASALGHPPANLVSCRASVRVNAKDTLPIAGQLPDGTFILTALGSRGFSHAPLLGADIAAHILDRPAALTPAQRERFAPKLSN